MSPKAHPPSEASGNGHSPGIAGRVDSLGRAAHSFTEELRGTAADFSHALDVRGRARRHPYLMVTAAAALGYVLGGGLFTRGTARVLGMAGRLAALPLLRSELMGLLSGSAEGEVDEGQRPTGAQDVPSPS